MLPRDLFLQTWDNPIQVKRPWGLRRIPERLVRAPCEIAGIAFWVDDKGEVRSRALLVPVVGSLENSLRLAVVVAAYARTNAGVKPPAHLGDSQTRLIVAVGPARERRDLAEQAIAVVVVPHRNRIAAAAIAAAVVATAADWLERSIAAVLRTREAHGTKVAAFPTHTGSPSHLVAAENAANYGVLGGSGHCPLARSSPRSGVCKHHTGGSRRVVEVVEGAIHQLGANRGALFLLILTYPASHTQR